MNVTRVDTLNNLMIQILLFPSSDEAKWAGGCQDVHSGPGPICSDLGFKLGPDSTIQ